MLDRVSVAANAERGALLLCAGQAQTFMSSLPICTWLSYFYYLSLLLLIILTNLDAKDLLFFEIIVTNQSQAIAKPVLWLEDTEKRDIQSDIYHDFNSDIGTFVEFTRKQILNKQGFVLDSQFQN